MNLVAKLLPPSNILLDLDVTSKKRMFEQAGLLFENNQGVARSLVFDSLFARERLGSTGLGQGLAIPHGRIKGLKEAVGAFVRRSEERRVGKECRSRWSTYHVKKKKKK